MSWMLWRIKWVVVGLPVMALMSGITWTFVGLLWITTGRGPKTPPPKLFANWWNALRESFSPSP